VNAKGRGKFYLEARERFRHSPLLHTVQRSVEINRISQIKNDHMATKKRFLENLIIDLSVDDMNLESSLRCMQYLSAVIGHQVLYEYLNLEINGYSDNTILPEYRTVYTKLILNVLTDYRLVEKIVLECPIVEKKIKQQKAKLLICEGVDALEKGKSKFELEMQNYTIAFARDISDFVYACYVTNTNYKILSMCFSYCEETVATIISTIRKRFLNLALKLSEEFGRNCDLADIISSPDRANAVIDNFLSEIEQI
jgi:hypothetical protein